MGLTADVAVAAAERVERSAGPAAGLALWRRLATTGGGLELRARAVLGGLRCATRMRDAGALAELVILWPTCDEGVYADIFAICKDLQRADLGAYAVDLAHAEVKRLRTARSLYMAARCLDVAGDSRALPAFQEAVSRAEAEGAIAIVHACRVRRAAWLARSSETLSEAIDEATRVSSADVTPEGRLVLSRILLRSTSRFVRTNAISMLDEIVSSGANADLAGRAVVALARHADAMREELTPLEVDRLLAVLSRGPGAPEVVTVRNAIVAIDRLARARGEASDASFEGVLADVARVDPELARLHERARDILAGRFEPASEERAAPPTVTFPCWTLVLDAVAALRDRAYTRAASALRSLAEASSLRGIVPPSVWTVAQVALATDDTEVREATRRLVASMINRASGRPPHGWLGLAHALAMADMDELAVHARRAAVLAKEPRATEAHVLALTRAGWQLAQSGQRAEAIECLREARALAGKEP